MWTEPSELAMLQNATLQPKLFRTVAHGLILSCYTYLLKKGWRNENLMKIQRLECSCSNYLSQWNSNRHMTTQRHRKCSDCSTIYNIKLNKQIFTLLASRSFLASALFLKCSWTGLKQGKHVKLSKMQEQDAANTKKKIGHKLEVPVIKITRIQLHRSTLGLKRVPFQFNCNIILVPCLTTTFCNSRHQKMI
jgi:hypothetical protein